VKLVILLVFLILTADRAVPQTDAEASAKSKVAALEQVWNQAYKSGDTTALAPILDDAIVLVMMTVQFRLKKNLVSQPRSQQQQVAPVLRRLV
jgi:hypothetical protein